jgi:prevent-host-death family protein
VFVLSRNRKGAIAETKIAAAATALDIPVLRPIVEHARYDLAFEIGDRILRVQCKWGGLDADGAVIKVSLQSNYLTPAGYVRNSYTSEEIDLVAVYCGDLDRCYLLPSSLACGHTSVFLRLTPPKNGQRACINLASDFEFDGAIAQLEERWRGTPEAAGSSPASSTSPPAPPELLQVGAHEFRNHFGYYLEQAAAGHEVLVSRRGRPYVRLIPVEPRLRLVAA